MEYNERWNREKFIEYRKLKKSGYTHQQLKEHFGDDIWYSGIYNKNANVLPWHLFDNVVKNINEIKLNPEKTYYISSINRSDLYENKYDHIITFENDDVEYVIVFMYYIINNLLTWNIIFTTKNQWIDYKTNLISFARKGFITKKEINFLDDIISKETEFNKLFQVLKKLSYVILDYYNLNLKGDIISIGETKNEVKIKLYRNIMKDSFGEFKEEEILDKNGNRYYLYKLA